MDSGGSVLTVTENLVGEETRIVVVIDERSENGDINVSRSPVVVVVSNSPHVLLVDEEISHGEVPGIVQNGTNGGNITSNEAHVTIEDFTSGENTSRGSVLAPEIRVNFGNSVNSDTVNVVSLDEILDPVNEVVADVGIILIEIGKTSESAVLDIVHVLVVEITVGDNAVRVIVFRLVEGNIFRVVSISVTHVVSNDIDHNPDISLVASVNKGLETISTAEVAVDFSHVLGSITVESVRIIIRDGGDPDSVEAQTKNIVEIVFNTLEVTTTVVGLSVQVAIRLISITESKSVSDDLVDVTSLPFLRRFSGNCNKKKCSN